MVLKVTLCQQHHLNGSDAVMNAFPNTANAFVIEFLSKCNHFLMPCENVIFTWKEYINQSYIASYLLLVVLSQHATLWKGLAKAPPPLCLDPDPRAENTCSSETSCFLQVLGKPGDESLAPGLPRAMGGGCG